MKIRLATILAAAVLLTAIALGQTAPAPAPASAAPSVVAVANIVSLFDRLDEKAAGDADIKKLSDDLNAQRRQRETDLQKLSDQLKLLNPDKPEYRKIQQDMLLQSMQLDGFNNYIQQTLLLEQRTRTMDLYRRINQAVEEYAKTNGIVLVLAGDDANLTGAKSMQEMILAIGNRKVLYARPDFDITDKLIRAMNTEYLRRSGH